MAVRILQWNACGLAGRRQEFQQFLLTHDIDIACIQETFLKPDKDLSFPGYTSIRSDRTAPKGGLAIFVRTGIIHAGVRTPNSMECQAVQVKTSVGLITIVNIYIPPGTTQPSFSDLFQWNNSIIVGDMNAKNRLWGSDKNDARGSALEDAITTHNYVVLNTGQGTYQTYGGSMTHIDVSLTSTQLATRCRWMTWNNTMGSDHVPIIITINARPEKQLFSGPKWKFAKADWITFRRFIDDKVETTEFNNDDVNQLNSKVTDVIIEAAKKSVPETKKTALSRRQKPLPYWNDDIKTAIRNRNRARNKMNRTKNIDDCIEYRRLKSIAQRVIRSTARQHWQSFCDKLTDTSRLSSVWSMARKMNGTKSNPSPASLLDDGNTVTDNNEKAEIFARTFATVSSSSNYSPKFAAYKADVEQNHNHLFENDAPDTDMSKHLNKEFVATELNRAIDQLRKNTAPGDDRIAYEFFQQMPPSGRRAVLFLFNAVWSTGRLPKSWKHAVILPILKPGKDPHQASSYRPISLTSTLSKLMERLVTNRLMWYLEKYNLLSNVQSGFRKGRNAIDHIVRLQDLISRHQKNKGYVLAVFIDFEKAFDMVWRKGLLLKLKSFSINGRMFNWIADFNTDRTFQVRVGDTLSSIHKLENGTNQGSMISPELFLCMIDDLPDCLQNVQTSLFADDSSLYKAGRNINLLQTAVQRDLSALQDWCDKWGFRISTEKTVAVLFTKSTNRPDVKLEINGRQIKVAKSTKFLGVIFDQQLTWSEHIDYISSKCGKRLNLMRAVSGARWGATHKSLVTIYRALIRSVLDYGALAYDSASTSQLQKLDRMQSSALKLCCGAMKSTAIAALQVECGEAPLRLRRLQHQIKFAVKVIATNNHVAKSVFEDQWTTHYGNFDDNSKPMALKVSPFLEEINVDDTEAPKSGNFAPWLVAGPDIDRSLTMEINKKDAPTILATLARDKISQEYSTYVHIYTDASKNETGRVGIGCHIQSTSSFSAMDLERRLTDGVAVQTGELAAIKLALENVRQLEQITAFKRYVIFTDSLSSVENFISGKSHSRPNLMNDTTDVLHTIKSQITLVWVPSHIGIPGNERADRLAYAATQRPHVDIEIGLELQETYKKVDSYITNLWQQEWNDGTTGRHFYSIQPDVTSKERPQFKKRSTEVLAHRLRLGRCQLNAYLYRIACHETGKCASCGQPETIDHYLISCPTNDVASKVQYICNKEQVEFIVPAILRSSTVLDAIHRFIDRPL